MTALLKQDEVRSSTLYQRILENIEECEVRSQIQDVEKMATSSSQATISGIYGALLDMENQNPNRRKKKRSHLRSKLVKSSTNRLSNSQQSSSQPPSSSVGSIQREISRDHLNL